MKKIFDIAFKDMTQSFRSLFALIMMFAVPILLTGMFYIMFGGSGEEEGFELPVTQEIVVNQDAGEIQFEAAFLEAAPEGFTENLEADGKNSIGHYLTTVLQSEGFSDIMKVTVSKDADQAKAAVDSQQAGVAILLPANLSDALTNPQETAAIEFYQDPTLTLGPSIVKGIVQQLVDGFISSGITLQVTFEQLASEGQTLDEATIQSVVGTYFQKMMGQSQTQSATALLNLQNPAGETVTEPGAASVVSLIMAGMSIFYLFFTGASTAQSLLSEETKGTLPRLFTTPTPKSTILGGKFTSGVLTITVQIIVLLGFGSLVFQIEWGRLVTLIPVIIGMVFASATFGIFLISWMRTERQAGIMIGGFVTIMGMVGMMPIFVAGISTPPQFVYTASKLVPQGWAVEALQTAMKGGAPGDVMFNTLVLLAWAAVFFIIGVLRFRKRFA